MGWSVVCIDDLKPNVENKESFFYQNLRYLSKNVVSLRTCLEKAELNIFINRGLVPQTVTNYGN